MDNIKESKSEKQKLKCESRGGGRNLGLLSTFSIPVASF